MKADGPAVLRSTDGSSRLEPDQLVEGLKRRRVVDVAREVSNKSEVAFFDDLLCNRCIQLEQSGVGVDVMIPEDRPRTSERL